VRRDWEPEELIDCWTLVDDDWALVANKSGPTRLGCVRGAAEVLRGRSFVFDVGEGELSVVLLHRAHRLRRLSGHRVVRDPAHAGSIGRWLYRPSAGVKWAHREADLVKAMEETLRRLKAAAKAAQTSADAAP